MNVKKQYDIYFKGLNDGEHRFSFNVDNKFFEAFENPEIKGGNASVNILLTKNGNVMILDFVIKGVTVVECDRCLEDCEIPVEFNDSLKVRISDKIAEQNSDFDGELLWINSSESALNVAQYIYESIVLSLPYLRVHKNGPDGKPECNPEMLKKFSIITEEEFDKIADKQEMQKMADNPQWNKLLDIKEKMLIATQTDKHLKTKK